MSITSPGADAPTQPLEGNRDLGNGQLLACEYFERFKRGEHLDIPRHLSRGESLFFVWSLESMVVEWAKDSMWSAFGIDPETIKPQPLSPVPAPSKEREPLPIKLPYGVKKHALAKFGGVCQKCGHDGSEHKLTFHHIEGTVKGGRTREYKSYQEAYAYPERFSLLCWRCHLEEHRKERRANGIR